MSFIEFKDVSKIYQMGEVEIKAIDRMSFAIEKGEFVVILGASGAGKTTVLNILGGMDKATEATEREGPGSRMIRRDTLPPDASAVGCFFSIPGTEAGCICRGNTERSPLPPGTLNGRPAEKRYCPQGQRKRELCLET